MWFTSRIRKVYYYKCPTQGQVDHVRNLKHLDIAHQLGPVIRFLNLFGLFNYKPTDQSRQILKLTYSFGVVLMLFVCLLLRAYEYREKIYEEPACTSAACVLKQLPSMAYGSFSLFVTAYTFFEFRKFQSIFFDWNMTMRKLQHCFPDARHLHISRKTIVVILCFYYGTTVLEHAAGDFNVAFNCIQQNSENKCDFFSHYYNHISHRQVSRHHHAIVTIVFYLSTKYSLIACNMTDFLVLVLGLCLVRNFDCFNHRFEDFVRKAKSSAEWTRVREVHYGLCDVLSRINDVLHPIIVVSVSMVCFFICHQLYLHLYLALLKVNVPEKVTGVSYGTLSLLHLLFRICGICIVGTKLSRKVKDPLLILRECHEEFNDCLEVRRFWDHIVDTVVSFKATINILTTNRAFLLKVMGIVTTYELVFLNLAKENQPKEPV